MIDVNLKGVKFIVKDFITNTNNTFHFQNLRKKRYVNLRIAKECLQILKNLCLLLKLVKIVILQEKKNASTIYIRIYDKCCM